MVRCESSPVAAKKQIPRFARDDKPARFSEKFEAAFQPHISATAYPGALAYTL
jgi:hypothetical protein